jgi:hypothetical protein
LFNSFAQMVQVDSIFWRPTPKRRANPAWYSVSTYTWPHGWGSP